MKQRWIAAAAALVAVPAVTLGTGLTADASPSQSSSPNHSSGPATTTPVKHMVVIFDENISFDHYFGTYPKAANNGDGPSFTAAPGTPTVNGLTNTLLTANPNSDQPTRLNKSQAVTCDQNHGYTAEQEAADNGLMDKFVQFTDSGDCSTPANGEYYEPGLVMDYYDGNTVTGLWNYANNYAMSDNSYDTVYGPSTPGALNLISGQTHGASVVSGTSSGVVSGTVIADPNPSPALDDCSSATSAGTITMSGTNIGDLLNKKNVTWGWFQGGFRPTTAYDPTKGVTRAVCGATTPNVAGAAPADYSAHHEPFEYYPSTANQHHLPPTSVSKIGYTDQANHQYDLTDFWASVDHGNMPAVSFLKAPEAQDGHAGYSDPVDEQKFLVSTINRLQKSSDWKDTAVVIAYDDSDGWYDHVMAPTVEKSDTPADSLSGQEPATSAGPATGQCGTQRATPVNPPANYDKYPARCGYGPRLPLLVISPFAKTNYVDHTLTDQTSILKFVEDNWSTGRIGDDSFDAIAGPITNMFDFSSHSDNGNDTLFLDPQTGQPTHR